MQCTYHPEAPAVQKCSTCGVPLCASCAGSLAPGQPVACSRCIALSSARDILDDSASREEEKKRAEIGEKKRQRRLKWLKRGLVAGGVLAVVVGNLIFYYFLAIPGEEPFDPKDAPLATAVIVDSAIQDYADDHNGTFPAALNQLLGTYLTGDDLVGADLDLVIYRRHSEKVYELRLRNPADDSSAEIVFSNREAIR